MTLTQQVELRYLSEGGVQLTHPADDVRGLVVVDTNGHRLGEIDDLVVDVSERRARLLSVVSGGILGLNGKVRLIPVELVLKVDDRVRVSCIDGDPATPDRSHGSSMHAPAGKEAAFTDAYEILGIVPFWAASHRAEAYFHQR